MTELLKWGNEEFRAGDRLVSAYDYRVLTIFDIHAPQEGNGGISVVLEIGQDGSRLMDAEEFAYRVNEGHLIRLSDPVYAVGQTMTHIANNNTIEILSISERRDWNKEYKYFIRMVDEKGRVSFTTVEETYLGRCLDYTRTVDPTISLPDIAPSTTFPGIVFV